MLKGYWYLWFNHHGGNLTLIGNIINHTWQFFIKVLVIIQMLTFFLKICNLTIILMNGFHMAISIWLFQKVFMIDTASLFAASDFLVAVNLITGFQVFYYVVLILRRSSTINSRTYIYLCSIIERDLSYWSCISMKMSFDSFIFVAVKLCWELLYTAWY